MLTEVDKIPELPSLSLAPSYIELTSFLTSNMRYAKTDFGNHTTNSAKSSYRFLQDTVMRHHLPIKVHLVGDDIYLERTDRC